MRRAAKMTAIANRDPPGLYALGVGSITCGGVGASKSQERAGQSGRHASTFPAMSTSRTATPGFPDPATSFRRVASYCVGLGGKPVGEPLAETVPCVDPNDNIWGVFKDDDVQPRLSAGFYMAATEVGGELFKHKATAKCRRGAIQSRQGVVECGGETHISLSHRSPVPDALKPTAHRPR
jgi:hypothetical protein